MVRRASGEIRFCARRLHGNLPAAISKARKALGPDHPDVAISLNNLGALYNDQASTVRPSCSTNGRSRSGRRRWGWTIPPRSGCVPI